MGIPGRRQADAGAGFTLVELVLTIALLLLLIGAVAVGFGSARTGAQLEEGAGQLESLFRFARAEAGSSGRRVQVRFVEAGDLGTTNSSSLTPGVVVEWEPDPLSEPGRFVPLTAAGPFADRVNDLVRFERMTESGMPESAAGWEEDLDPDPGLESPDENAGIAADLPEALPAGIPPVGFYPDGSSDSAELVLVSQDEADGRRLRLELSGLTGAVRLRWIAAEGEPEDPEGTDESMTEASGTGFPTEAVPQ